MWKVPLRGEFGHHPKMLEIPERFTCFRNFFEVFLSLLGYHKAAGLICGASPGVGRPWRLKMAGHGGLFTHTYCGVIYTHILHTGVGVLLCLPAYWFPVLHSAIQCRCVLWWCGVAMSAHHDAGDSYSIIRMWPLQSGFYPSGNIGCPAVNNNPSLFTGYSQRFCTESVNVYYP